jgi:hypothetical protein
MSASANTGNPVFRLGRYPGNGRGPKSVRKLKGIADPSDGDRDCRSPLDNTGACFALGFKLTHYRPRRGCATCAARPQPRARINPLRSKEPAQRAGPNAHRVLRSQRPERNPDQRRPPPPRSLPLNTSRNAGQTPAARRTKPRHSPDAVRFPAVRVPCAEGTRDGVFPEGIAPVSSPGSLPRPLFGSHIFSIAGSNTGAEREVSQGRVLCAA